MPPNTIPSLGVESVPDRSKVGNMPSAPPEISSRRYLLQICQACLSLLGYILIGLIVGVNLLFAYRNGTSLSSVDLHIVLCVIGFQLLMGVGILLLASESGFASSITLQHKRWIHTFLQVVGSGIALAGCFIMSLVKTVNFNTLHGKFSLVAMVFTIVSFFNGIASLYAFEWRKCLPGNLSKLTHILFGIAAFAFASVSLAYGFKKSSFRGWATQEFTEVLYVITAIFTAICILNPFITFFTKMNNVIRK